MDAIVGKISALLVIDNEGNKLLGKYYTTDVKKEDATSFEKRIFQRASKLSSKLEGGVEIMSFEKYTVIFKFFTDISIYILGGSNDNELIYSQVLELLVNCLTILLTNVERKKVVENMSNFLIICDEIIEDGMVLTLNQEDVLSQIYKRQKDSFSFSSVLSYIDNYISKENTSRISNAYV